MKLNRKTVFWGIFAALLLASTASSALTLGRVRGAALLGRPLDLVVPVQYGADEEVAANCFEADVSYADSPLERSRISIRTEPTSQANTLLVHVTSAANIDEAVVRLTLRATCNPKASRSYAVLSDVVSETSGGAVTASAGRTTAATGDAKPAIPAAAAAGQVAAGAASANAATATPAKPPVAAAAAAERRAARAERKPPAATQTDAGAAKTSAKPNKSQVSAAALEDLQRRVDQIAKWQEANGGDEERQKSEERAKALEADIRGLQVVTAKNQQSIQTVAAAMEASSSQDYGRTLVYGLGAALLVCLAGLVFVASRMRSGAAAPWWSGEQGQAAPETVLPPHVEEALASHLDPSAPAALVPNPEPAQPAASSTWPTAAAVPTGLGEIGPSMDFTATTTQAAVANKPAAKKPGRPDFTASGHGNLKSVNTKEMLDVRQQAEFFMALGQHDEAVRLLESHITGSSDSNPMVLLDLLKILHTLSRRSEFERYREEFNAQFTGRIPDYANFLSEGNGLEAYEDICHQIVVLWPTEYTVDFIEQCLVRLPEDDPEQGMDLEAFKDLLLLYGVLKRLDQGYDSNLAPFSTSRSDNLTQSATVGATIKSGIDSGATVPLPEIATGSYGAPTVPVHLATPLDLDLDLDLSLDEPVAQAPKPAESNNLIDFDISGYITENKPDTSK